MAEKSISIDGIDLLDFYGVANSNFNRICDLFPKLKIVARGNAIKAIGTEEEIARLESECLEMFYGRKSSKVQTYTFNVPVTADKNQYMVCRFSDKEGVVAADDLTGAPVMGNVAVNKCQYPQLRTPGEKDKGITEYTIVSSASCQLIAETTLLDSLTFVSPLYNETRISLSIK